MNYLGMLSLKSYEDVQKAFLKAKDRLSEILSAFEFWDSTSNKMVHSHLTSLRNPLGDDAKPAPFYVLVETQGSNENHDTEKLEGFIEDLFNEDIIENGALAQDTTQIASMWNIREGIPEACSKSGAVFKFDVR